MHQKIRTPTFVAFDLETTGFDPEINSIIEVGAIKFTYNQKGELIKLGELSQLVNPETEIPVEVQLITGIKNSDVSDQPKFSELISEIKIFFDNTDYLIGHNVAFDVSFISKYLKLNKPILDSQLFAEIFFPGLPSYSLDVIPFELGIKRQRAHRAYDDSLVSAEVFLSSLKQFVALRGDAKNIIEVLNKGSCPEATILSQALTKIVNKKIFTPIADKSKPIRPITKLQNSVIKIAKNLNQHILTHTAVPGASETLISSCLNIAKQLDAPLLVSAPNKKNLLTFDQQAYLGNIKNHICDVRLKKTRQRSSLTRAEAILAAKLTVSLRLNKNLIWWPKISSEEKTFLPEFLYSGNLCGQHQCLAEKKIKSLAKTKNVITATHYDLWNIEIKDLPEYIALLLIDFDEAADTLTKHLETKLHVNYLPSLLRAVSQIAGSVENRTRKKKNEPELPLRPKTDSNIESIIAEIINKNDLFWGLLAINYSDYFKQQSQLHITPSLQQEADYQKLVSLIQKILELLLRLQAVLEKSKHQHLAAFAPILAEATTAWNTLTQNDSGLHLYLEKEEKGLVIRLTPSFKYVSNYFKQYTSRKTLLTAATGSDNITSHYTTLLDINNWPRTNVVLQSKKRAYVKIIKSERQPVDIALQILLEHEHKKAVVVAKNLKEIILYAEHLTKNLDSGRKIFYLDKSGGGVNRALYNFVREEGAILIIPPRGRVLKYPWPGIDLAVISSIPFPPPQASLGFMDWAMPQAMLSYKHLLAKILSAGNTELKLYLIDNRLTNSDYGQNFISLASELCGCKPEIELM